MEEGGPYRRSRGALGSDGVDVLARGASNGGGPRRVHERRPAPAARQVGDLARCEFGSQTDTNVS